MRCVDRNKQTIYYATYTGKTAVTDSNGCKTGEFTVTYSSPTEIRANVSAAKGSAELSMFGIDLKYSKTITVTDMACPIAEDSILWIGVPTSAKANYVVMRVAKSINSITYAVDEVV